MTLSRKQVVALFLIILMSPVLFWLLLWASILTSSDVYTHDLSKTGLWPIICSTKGCVTTSGWHKHYQSLSFFNQATENDAPNPEEALTTLARQHLVNKAMSNWPVSIREARRYREEVLQVKDEQKILATTGMSVGDYDKYVILPLLKQEVLKEQKNIQEIDELYKQLSNERKMWVLPRGLIWDKETATVVKR
jgi:hypothetical protein